MTVPAIPSFLYGTAWKEAETARLVGQALAAGFRGIDTANQRRHYHEAAVGEALAEAITEGLVTRADVFLQSKFTHRGGQDQRLPYDPAADIGTQVRQSFASSLEHLRVESLDSLVLHGPSSRSGLHADDVAAWKAMEAIQADGGTRFLGVSNVSLEQLETLCELAAVQPTFVQNRCFAVHGWDQDVRTACSARGITYQGFSLLTANVGVLQHPQVTRIAARLGCTSAQVIFAFALTIGMLPLTGTSDASHAREDLAAAELVLTEAEVALIETLATR